MNIAKRIGRFVLGVVAWFLFASATISLVTATLRSISGVSYGFVVDIIICTWIALSYCIWWRLR